MWRMQDMAEVFSASSFRDSNGRETDARFSICEFKAFRLIHKVSTAKARCKRKTGRRAVQVSECARRGGGDEKKTPRFSLIIGTFSAILGNFSGHPAEFSSGLRTALRRSGKKTCIHSLLRGAPGRWRAE